MRPSWSCAAPAPVADDEGLPGYSGLLSDDVLTEHSFLACNYHATPLYQVPIAVDGSTIPLATVAYRLDRAGTDVLSLSHVVVSDDAGVEIFSCEPVLTSAGGCGTAIVISPPTPFEIDLDCDATTPVVDTVCPPGVGPLDLAVVVKNNSGPADSLAGFEFTVVNPDTAHFVAPQPPVVACPALDANPDFDEGLSGHWVCTIPALPIADDEGVNLPPPFNYPGGHVPSSGVRA